MRAYRRRENDNPVDLFPFLSMFLCILGVLSFLSVMMAASGGQRVALVSEDGPGLRAPVQIFCTSEGLVVIPPVEGLRALEHVTETSDRATLRRIERDRRARRAALARNGLRASAAPLDEEAIGALLAEVREVNRIARRNHHAYQEFVLFGVYPGGGEQYQRVRAALESPPYRELESGIEVLDRGFEMSAAEAL